ncbi:MAG: DUF4412 domain-containing protein [Acidobacteriota bacterium]
MRRVIRLRLFVLLLLAVLPTQLDAELKFTLHTDLNRIEGVTPNDWSALISQLAGNVVPAGGVDHVVLVGDKAMRMEQKQTFAGMPAGMITLYRDGARYGINPAAQTFWKYPPQLGADELKAMAGRKPEVKVVKSGQVQTINGMRAEQVTTTLTMPMPGEIGASGARGLPGELMVTFDVWVTASVKPPAGWVPLIDQEILSRLGLSSPQSFTDNRFPLKAVVRVNLVNAMEVLMTVKDIANQDVPDSVFEIPKGYKEVSPRGGRGTPPSR